MAHEKFHHITVQLLPDDESPVPPMLGEKSVFFRCAYTLQLDRVVLPLAPDVKKDKSLGELFYDILPVDGEFQIDLATHLPYYLPYFDNSPDYAVTVGDSELVISTRMVRCFYAHDDSQSQLRYWLLHRRGLPDLIGRRKLNTIHPLPIRTFVAKTFRVKATTVETAIQDGFYKWIEELAIDVSRLIEAIRAVSPEHNRHILPVFAVNAFPLFYIVVTGADGKTGIEQFASHAEQTALRAHGGLSAEDLSQIRAALKMEHPIPVEDSAIALARSYLYHGYCDLALVQTCIACESVLAKRYRNFLLSRGVSKNKYKAAERDIMFSHLLNLHLATICDLQTLPDRERVLERLNWARHCRNEVVHTGSMQRTPTIREVETAIDAADELIKFLRQDA